MSIYTYTIEVTGATGGAGVATANATSSEIVNGTIRAIHALGVDSPPATMDITIAGTSTPATPLFTVANVTIGTGLWYYPMAQAQLNTDGTDITNTGTPIVVNDLVKVTIAQVNNDDGLTVTLLVER